MSEFDKWWEENYMNVSSDRTEAEDIYNLGVESQQAKIDKLKSDNQLSESQIGQACVKWKEIAEKRQAKIDILEVQLRGAEERAKLILDHKNKMVDELQKKYDAMYNAFVVADDCRKEWHESYMNVRLERDELQARVDELKITQNNLELKAEDAECVSMSLDDQGVEKCDDDGKSYSLWGRVCQFKKSNNITERDELQARIDRVVHILTYTNHASTPLCNELRDILKGNKDEN